MALPAVNRKPDADAPIAHPVPDDVAGLALAAWLAEQLRDRRALWIGTC